MQYCVASVDINDCPRFLTTFPQEKFHCNIEKYEYGARNLLPLSLQGVTSVLKVFKINEIEWTWGDSPQIFLTDKDLHWETNSSICEEQEHTCTYVIGDPLPPPNGL